MAKRVFIVHRWYGSPDADWYPWLKKELENEGFKVSVPLMPNPDAPEIQSWVETLRKAVGRPDTDTYLIGHSVGCQTILRYLESWPTNAKIGGAVFIAGWLTLTSQAMPSKTEETIARPWIETPIDAKRVQQHAAKSTAIFSDNDPYVPLDENAKAFKHFGAKVIIEHNQGHYDENTLELPSALHALLEIATP